MAVAIPRLGVVSPSTGMSKWNRTQGEAGKIDTPCRSVNNCSVRLPALTMTFWRFLGGDRVFLCFLLTFVLTTLVQQGPGGAPWGVPVCTLHLDSDAGYAVLLLTLLGAPVIIGRALGGLMP